MIFETRTTCGWASRLLVVCIEYLRICVFFIIRLAIIQQPQRRRDSRLATSSVWFGAGAKRGQRELGSTSALVTIGLPKVDICPKIISSTLWVGYLSVL